MNSRRRISAPKLRASILSALTSALIGVETSFATATCGAADVRDGSNRVTLTVRPDHFRSTPMNGHLQSRSACLKVPIPEVATLILLRAPDHEANDRTRRPTLLRLASGRLWEKLTQYCSCIFPRHSWRQ